MRDVGNKAAARFVRLPQFRRHGVERLHRLVEGVVCPVGMHGLQLHGKIARGKLLCRRADALHGTRGDLSSKMLHDGRKKRQKDDNDQHDRRLCRHVLTEARVHGLARKDGDRDDAGDQNELHKKARERPPHGAVGAFFGGRTLHLSTNL